MTKLLIWYFGHDPRVRAEREAFAIGVSRLVDPRPRLQREALDDEELFAMSLGDMGGDWHATGGDLRSAVKTATAK